MTTLGKSLQDFNLDEILVELGHSGKFQIRNCFFLSIAVVFSAFSISYVFTASNPSYRCYIPECEEKLNNDFTPTWLENAVPWDTNKLPRQCERYHYISSRNSTISKCTFENFDRTWIEKCNEFVFKPQIKTIANTFNIYCENNLWKLTLPGTIHSFGDLFSMILTGLFSDRFGRRAALVWCIFFSVIFGVIRSLSTTYTMFLIFEFLDAFTGGSIYASAFILGTEMVAPFRRVLFGVIVCSAYPIGEAILGLVAWKVDTWRELIWYTHIPFLLIPVYFWIVPESVRWLISKNRHEDFDKTLQAAAKVNGVIFSKQTLYKIEMLKHNMTVKCSGDLHRVDKSTDNDQTLWKAFTNVSMLLRIINCSFCWIACIFVYYGLSFTSIEIDENMFLNFITISLIEIPAYITCYFIMNKIGRRFSLSVFLICSGIACYAFIFISNNLPMVKLIFYLFGKFSITIAVTALYVLTAEIFPTPLRQSLMGVCSMIGRIGTISAPQMPLLAKIWISFPLFLFGSTSVLSGLLSLLFPETLGMKLPDTIDEALHIGKNKIKS